MIRRRTLMTIALGAGTISAGAGVLATLGTGTAGAQAACRTATFQWTSPSVGLYMTPDHNQTYETGLTIPAPAAGEELEILDIDWVSYDRYPEGTQPTRADHDQGHEVWGITVGGDPIGGLTADVPDTIEEGAVNEWFSGLVAGSFSGGPSQGGAVVLRHASLYGFTESANSVHPHAVSFTVQYCEVAPAVTTTVAPTTAAPAPTTAPADPVPAPAETTTTAPSSSAAETTVVVPPTTAPGTTVLASPPIATSPTVPTTSTTIVPAGPTVPATTPTTSGTPAGSLPETGSSVGGFVVAGSAFVAVGAAFALMRRRLLV